MPRTWRDWINTVQCMDCLEGMKQMPEGVVHCVVTSPPYYGLRDYGTAKWEGGEADCDHKVGGQVQDSKAPGAITAGVRPGVDASRCKKCGARCIDLQLGLEKTPEEYVAKMVEVFREVKRIMHPTGTLWLNMGDSYAGSWGAMSHDLEGKGKRMGFNERPPQSFVKSKRIPRGSGRWGGGNVPATGDLKPKDLMEIPSDLVRALRADGWWLRCRIPWLKRNAMPESVTDRPTQAVEYVFLLSKSHDYFYDGEAVRVPHSPDGRNKTTVQGRSGSIQHRDGERWPGSGRSRRNSDWFFESWQGLWTDDNGEPLAFIVNPKPYKKAHFATFSPGLVIPCIKAGTSERGACPECGSPWVRVVEKTTADGGERKEHEKYDGKDAGLGTNPGIGRAEVQIKTLGWRPTCSCGHKETVPCVVLDPFVGSGTSAEVAIDLDRDFFGIDLNGDYLKDFAQPRVDKALARQRARLAQEVLKLETKT